MNVNGLELLFLRFIGPHKKQAEVLFTSGLNIIYGASDTGKSFIVETIDFMLGARDPLRDIPERIGYDTVLLGLRGGNGKAYTLQRSADGGSFLRFDSLLDQPGEPQDGQKLSARHSHKNVKNLSRFLLQQIGLDERKVLFKKETGATKSLSFRQLAHLAVISAGQIRKASSPIESDQVVDRTLDYSVFKLLLTGVDDSALILEPEPLLQASSRTTLGRDALEQMIAAYEEELAGLTDSPSDLDSRIQELDEKVERFAISLRNLESRLEETTRERMAVWERYSSLNGRRAEIDELQARFSLLDQHYASDLRRLRAIQESGVFFTLLDPVLCPLCGAPPGAQVHTAVCDGNVQAVVEAAVAEMRKTEVLRLELGDTREMLSQEHDEVLVEIGHLEERLSTLQQSIDAAVSPRLMQTQTSYSQLLEARAQLRQATAVRRRLDDARLMLQGAPSILQPMTPSAGTSGVTQEVSKTVLDQLSRAVEHILTAWHFPDARDVYFDEGKRDLVIGGKPRGSRGSGLCAITHAAFTIGLMDYCRNRELFHPGFVVLDSPLLAYKEPQGDDLEIAGTDLKERFYEHLVSFAGEQQIIIVDNEEPPPSVLEKNICQNFTRNPNLGRFGFFPV